ncbi:hypothetical protein GCM10022393_26590 [Aquimarina addita]|uniref:DUF6787 domain-containing protein n=1 Tax=Aquimarina addita TaxID=870485 RepID=A0ABP6UP04_9FLAO
MEKFKDRWEIKANWQLIFPVLGLLGLVLSSYLISNKIVTSFLKVSEHQDAYLISLIILTIFFLIPLLGGTLWIFKILEKKWKVNYRWEMIAIFMVFAITGSTAAKISDPIISLLGFYRESTSGWIYWPLRILLIFPVYQLLLVFIGWFFGQFTFFWEFEKKMLSRLGFARLFKQ